MKARIIGPASELGDIGNGLTIFGHTLTREWSDDFEATPEDAQKLKGNRYVEVKAAKSDAIAGRALTATSGNVVMVNTPGAAADDATVKARLDELGVTYAKNASSKTLHGLLDTAEKAQAKAEQEAEDAQAEADRLAAEADHTAD